MHIVVGVLFGGALGVLLIDAVRRPIALPSHSDFAWTDRSISMLLVGVTVLIGVGYGWNASLRHDEAVFVVTNIAVADGNLPYVAAFDNTGPLGPLVGAPGVWIGRMTNVGVVEGVRLWYGILAAGLGSLTFLLGRSIGLDRRWSTVSAASILIIPTVNRELLSGPRPKLLVTLLLVGVAIAFIRRQWLLGGVLVGLAGLLWQPAWIFGPAVVMATEGEFRRQIRYWLLAFAGTLATLGVVAIPYLGTGHLAELRLGLVGWNARYLVDRSNAGVIERMLDPLKDVWGAHQATWPVIVFGIAAILPFFGTFLQSTRIDRRSSLTLAAFVGLFVLWTLFDYQGVVDLVPIFGFSAVGFAAFLNRITERRDIRSPAIVALVLLAALGLFEFLRTFDQSLPSQRSEYEMVGQAGSIVSYADPVALAVTDSRNPHELFFAIPGRDRYLREHSGFDAYLEDLLAAHPVLLAGSVTGSPTSFECYLAGALPQRGFTPTEIGWIDADLHHLAIPTSAGCS